MSSLPEKPTRTHSQIINLNLIFDLKTFAAEMMAKKE
jgi:hypothetical protein